MCINTGSYSTSAVSGSVSYPGTLHVFTVKKMCVFCKVYANTCACKYTCNPYICVYICIYIYKKYTWVGCQNLSCQFPLSAVRCLSLFSGVEKGLFLLYFCVYLRVPFYFGLGHEFHKEGRVVISLVFNFFKYQFG
jgi:hypothetical protein